LPAAWTEQYGLPPTAFVLYVIGGAIAAVSLLATLIHLSGRWFATKAVNRLQAAIRRRVLAHAVRLPLFRVYQLKSGGATSLLRDDAGGVSSWSSACSTTRGARLSTRRQSIVAAVG